jgi:hypothetical protein
MAFKMESPAAMRFLIFPQTTAIRVMLGIVFLTLKSYASFGFNIDGTLDKKAISHAYFEGEFSRILPPLETFRQTYPNPTKDDQIFVYKYLSVIYAADSSSRKKAESCMVQLLKLMPTIELIDLYISDNIESIFRNVKTSYLNQQQYVEEHDVYGHPSATGNDSVTHPKPKKESHAWAWWSAGGVSLVAVATTLYFVEFNSSSPGKKYGVGN